MIQFLMMQEHLAMRQCSNCVSCLDHNGWWQVDRDCSEQIFYWSMILNLEAHHLKRNLWRGINRSSIRIITLIENNMVGYVNAIGSMMKTLISLMLRTISNENTGIGFLGKIFISIISQNREAMTTKYLSAAIIWMPLKKLVEWSV